MFCQRDTSDALETELSLEIPDDPLTDTLSEVSQHLIMLPILFSLLMRNFHNSPLTVCSLQPLFLVLQSSRHDPFDCVNLYFTYNF